MYAVELYIYDRGLLSELRIDKVMFQTLEIAGREYNFQDITVISVHPDDSFFLFYLTICVSVQSCFFNWSLISGFSKNLLKIIKIS